MRVAAEYIICYYRTRTHTHTPYIHVYKTPRVYVCGRLGNSGKRNKSIKSRIGLRNSYTILFFYFIIVVSDFLDKMYTHAHPGAWVTRCVYDGLIFKNHTYKLRVQRVARIFIRTL